MLSNSKLQTIVLTAKLHEAEKFYGDFLGLPIKSRSDGALVFDVNGGDLRVCPVPSTTPTEHTVLGFAVPNVTSIIDTLTNRGIVLEKFDGLPHKQDGTLISPDGSKVAWFRDPDGNLLSIVQFAKGL